MFALQRGSHLWTDAVAKPLVLFPASLPHVFSYCLDGSTIPEDDPISQVCACADADDVTNRLCRAVCSLCAIVTSQIPGKLLNCRPE